MLRGVVFLAVLLGCHPPSPSTSPGSTQDEQGRIAAMRVRTVQVNIACEEFDGVGSAVHLRPFKAGAMLVTASHVAMEGCELSVKGNRLEVLSRDDEHDIAIVYAPSLGGVHTDFSGMYLGMEVFTVGYPVQKYDGEARFQVSRGYVMTDYGDRLKVSSPFYFGNSGGPTFSQDGRLVGIVTSMFTYGPVPLEYYIAPARAVRALLVETELAWSRTLVSN